MEPRELLHWLVAEWLAALRGTGRYPSSWEDAER